MGVPEWSERLIGAAMLGFVGLYVLGSLMHFRPLKIGKFELFYPRPAIVSVNCSQPRSNCSVLQVLFISRYQRQKA